MNKQTQEFYKTINNKTYHIVYVPITTQNAIQITLNYENKGYTNHSVYNNCVILYKEI